MKIYNEKTARVGNGSIALHPMLSMTAKCAFRLNKPAVKLLGMKASDGITIRCDDRNGEWYIHASTDGIRAKVNKKGLGTFASSALHADLAEACGRDKGAMRIVTEPVKMDGVKCFTILIGSVR